MKSIIRRGSNPEKPKKLNGDFVVGWIFWIFGVGPPYHRTRLTNVKLMFSTNHQVINNTGKLCNLGGICMSFESKRNLDCKNCDNKYNYSLYYFSVLTWSCILASSSGEGVSSWFLLTIAADNSLSSPSADTRWNKCLD